MRTISSSKLGALSVLALACSVGAAACSADVAPGPGEATVGPDEEVASTEAEVRASCTNPRLYFVALRTACKVIPGHRGRWVPEPIFADAPEDVQEGTCAYRWVGARWSRADRDAFIGEVGAENAIAPACGSASAPDIGEIREIPALDIWSQAGSVGCDVCGRLRREKIRVILPPDKIGKRQFMVPLTNGSAKYFEIEPTDARALSIQLPPPPPGTFYEAGRIHIY